MAGYQIDGDLICGLKLLKLNWVGWYMIVILSYNQLVELSSRLQDLLFNTDKYWNHLSL